MSLPKIDESIQATVNGRTVSGTVKFVTPTFISVNQGNGLVAIFRFDANRNCWHMGPFRVTWAVTETLQDRLNRLVALVEARYSRPASG